eukprot:540394_1
MAMCSTDIAETPSKTSINEEEKGIQPLLKSHDLKGLSEYIKSSKCKKIAILAGAGMSCSAGIPDFRSKNGFYNTVDLSKYPLTTEQLSKCQQDPTYCFHINLFKENPTVYFEIRRPMLLQTMKYKPTLSHWFIRLLYDKGLLKRFYSTNIDGLDQLTGIPDDILISVHGTLSKAKCMKCSKYANMKQFRNCVQNRKYPIICNESYCNGLIKPCTIFYGENLPNVYTELTQNGDVKDVDLFIVIGSSLTVPPSKFLPYLVDLNRCVRFMVNKTRIDNGFSFDNEKLNDICYEGNCDDAFRELAKLLNWDKELEMLINCQIKNEVEEEERKNDDVDNKSYVKNTNVKIMKTKQYKCEDCDEILCNNNEMEQHMKDTNFEHCMFDEI